MDHENPTPYGRRPPSDDPNASVSERAAQLVIGFFFFAVLALSWRFFWVMAGPR